MSVPADQIGAYNEGRDAGQHYLQGVSLRMCLNPYSMTRQPGPWDAWRRGFLSVVRPHSVASCGG